MNAQIKTQYNNCTAAQIVRWASEQPQINGAGGVFVSINGADAQLDLTERGNAVALSGPSIGKVWLRCSERTARQLKALRDAADAVLAAELKAEREAALVAGGDL